MASLAARPARAQTEPTPSAPTPTAPAPTPDFGAFFNDPVLHGAWLWQANCVRCHGDYADDRVGEDLKPKELQGKISGADRNGCDVDWAITKGGPLAIAEIKDIGAYIAAWEDHGRAPDLAPLLPIPAPTARPTPTSNATPQAIVATVTPSVDTAIAALLKQDPVYEGAWLYAENCVVCHLSYESARQAALNDDATVHGLITNGKMGTSMPAFGLLVGGTLRRAQIDAIVTYMRTWENLGGPPELPGPIAEEMAKRTSIALAMPTLVGAPPSFAPTPVPAPASAQTVSSAAPNPGERADSGLWGIFVLLSAMGALMGAGLFVGAMVCTAILPPKRPPIDPRG